jgi:hypothetical protein
MSSEFRTRDVYLVAWFFSHGLRAVHVEKSREYLGLVEFVFGADSGAAELATRYYAGAAVSAFEFAEGVRRAKRLLFSAERMAPAAQ